MICLLLSTTIQVRCICSLYLLAIRHVKECPKMHYFGIPRHNQSMKLYAFGPVILGIPSKITKWDCCLHAVSTGVATISTSTAVCCNCEVSQKALTVCGIYRMILQLWCMVIKSSNTVSARMRQGLFRIIPHQVGMGSPIKTNHTPWLQTSISIYLLESQ